MNTNKPSSLPRSRGAVASSMFGGIALSIALFACTAPTEAGPSEETGTASEALANNGGGTGSTCDSRWQNCYISCGAAYGLKNPKTQADCEALCDDIHVECTSVARPVDWRPILNRPPVSIAH